MNNKRERIIAVVLVVILVVIIAAVILSKTVMKTGAICGQADEYNKSICLSEAARTTNDSSYCAKITNHNLFYACQDKLWQIDPCTYAILLHKDCDDYRASESITEKNISLCYFVVSDTKKQDCLFELAKISLADNKNYCETCTNIKSYHLPSENFPSGNFTKFSELNYTEKIVCYSGCFSVYFSRTNDSEGACHFSENKPECIDSFLNPKYLKLNTSVTRT